MKNLLKLMSATAIAMVAYGTANAASITNNDAESQTLLVTEDGVRTNVVIATGETIAICENGCFLTAPNGDRAVLQGGERVTIQGGALVVE